MEVPGLGLHAMTTNGWPAYGNLAGHLSSGVNAKWLQTNKQQLCSNTFHTISILWIWYSLQLVVFAYPEKCNFGGTGRRETNTLAPFEDFDAIVEHMFPSLKESGQALVSYKYLVRFDWSEQPHNGKIVASMCCSSYWSDHNHCIDDEIHLSYLFIPPPVVWFHFDLDTFLIVM